MSAHSFSNIRENFVLTPITLKPLGKKPAQLGRCKRRAAPFNSNVICDKLNPINNGTTIND